MSNQVKLPVRYTVIAKLIGGSRQMDLASAERSAIRTVIEQQLRAFQQDDAATAFSFASRSIQAQFDTPENFISMVKTAYEAVYRPRSVMFEEVIEVDGYPAQKVILMATSGELMRAIYLMQKQTDLSWKIHGCFLLPVEEQLNS